MSTLYAKMKEPKKESYIYHYFKIVLFEKQTKQPPQLHDSLEEL